ncbi:hypothetical protein GCM10019016_035710 [Streptomyces prasinosporus]|uniref:Uncharacterized protein n=1 Tax=Streptomyces prasinosporus TaxID=68256 RepID=A0ABP6TNQ4_9ACTN
MPFGRREFRRRPHGLSVCRSVGLSPVESRRSFGGTPERDSRQAAARPAPGAGNPAVRNTLRSGPGVGFEDGVREFAAAGPRDGWVSRPSPGASPRSGSRR